MYPFRQLGWPRSLRQITSGKSIRDALWRKNNSDFTRTEQKRRFRVQVRKWVYERHLNAWSHFLHKKNGSRCWKMRFGMIAFCRFSKVAVPTSAKNGRGVREQLEIVFSLVFLCIQRVKKHRFLVYPALVSGLRDRQLFSQIVLNFKKPILFTIMEHDKTT